MPEVSGEHFGNTNIEEEHVRTDNGETMLVDWNDIDIIRSSPERLDAPGANDNEGDCHSNDGDLHTDAPTSEPPYSPTVADDNDFNVDTDEPSNQLVIANASSLQCGTSDRIPEHEDMQVKQLFPNKKNLISKLQLLAVKCHFEFKVKKSNKSIYTVVCIEKNCKWRLRAIKIKESPNFEVRKYNGHHSCSMSVRRRDHRHASYMVIGNHIAPKYQDANRVYIPRDIISDIRREFGITISYTKAYMAKSFASGLIRGKPRESYAKLPSYCHVLEVQNPGTLTFIHTTDDDRFKYLFYGLGTKHTWIPQLNATGNFCGWN
ncbi:Uncharacterized protein Adt_42818 [Abeliophyllum distichum]|uniref:Transposase MuDR plant domain-containing protein n=1 Tax=Abeliophyllum distichum TaxID=126358 RepID=A0ABD1PSR2_9LAMI